MDMDSIAAQVDSAGAAADAAAGSPTIFVLVALCLLGLVLWALGGKLARPATVIGGLVVGGLVGLGTAEVLGYTGNWLLALIVAGALVGGALAGGLFRLWMAIAAGLVLATVVPAATLVWYGTAPPEVDTPTRQQARELASGFLPGGIEGPAGTDETEADGEADTGASAGALVRHIVETVRSLYAPQLEQVQAWWDELDAAVHRRVALGAALGGVIGLLLGLVSPKHAAILQSALVGAVLMVLPGRRLIETLSESPPAWLVQSPRATLITLGLITVLGLGVQWTLSRKKTDK